jgi:hypothetical protein
MRGCGGFASPISSRAARDLAVDPLLGGYLLWVNLPLGIELSETRDELRVLWPGQPHTLLYRCALALGAVNVSDQEGRPPLIMGLRYWYAFPLSFYIYFGLALTFSRAVLHGGFKLVGRVCHVTVSSASRKNTRVSEGFLHSHSMLIAAWLLH